MAVFVGIVVILIGLALLLRGYATIRVIISIFGGIIGFWLAATITAQLTHTATLGNPLGWIMGLAAGILCGMLSFFVYHIAMIGGMAAIGYTIGVSILIGLQIENRWASIAVGLVCAVLLGYLAYRFNLPGVAMVILTTLVGASMTSFGLMLMTAQITLKNATEPEVARLIEGPGWYLVYLALVVVGLIMQWRHIKSHDPLRAQWRR